MFMNSIAKSSVVQPKMDEEHRPNLEKRRIVGSLRERIVYLQSPSKSQLYQDNESLELQKALLFEQLLDDLAKRINNHVENELTAQQINIDHKIEEIDEHTNSNLLIQDSIERQLKKLRKKLKQRNNSHSQPVTSCRSKISICKNAVDHFSCSSEFPNPFLNDDDKYDADKYEQTMKKCSNAFFTNLW